jgi:hypothetical protein
MTRRGHHAARRRLPVSVAAVAVFALVATPVGLRLLVDVEGPATSLPSRPTGTPTERPSSSHTPPSPPTATRDPRQPINTEFEGITTFRGNATRTFYGRGPVPRDPETIWRYPASGSLCSRSSDQHGEREWCGTGWTGQPNVIVGPRGGVEVRVGAYDGAYHFVDGRTGMAVRPSLPTGDLAKGSATSDPDGYPLYYAGSRDNLFRIVALDRPRPTVLWTLDSVSTVPRPLWNNDWDGAALVIDDHLIEGSENSWVYVVRLNRGYDDRGRVRVDPEVVATIPGFDDRLLADLPDTDVSIENSVSFRDDVVYFANSGGLVQGWDISDVLDGGRRVRRVFRFWTGDDTDASVVIDADGSLYVGSEYQRFGDRSRAVGQIMKLDPSHPHDPLVWSVDAREIGFDGAGGTWSTPALHEGLVYTATAAGRVLAIDADDGEIVWETRIGEPSIASPVLVADVLIQGDCTGVLHAWDVSNPRRIRELWTIDLGRCIESTPAVWDGWIYVGTRGGQLLGIADRRTAERDAG